MKSVILPATSTNLVVGKKIMLPRLKAGWREIRTGRALFLGVCPFALPTAKGGLVFIMSSYNKMTSRKLHGKMNQSK